MSLRYRRSLSMFEYGKTILFFHLLVSPCLVFSQQLEEVNDIGRSLRKTPDIIWSTYIGKLVAALIIVIILFLIFAKAMKRFQSTTTLGDGISIVAGLSVGSKEKILVLDVGTQQIVVGVTPGQITTLLELAVPIDRTNSGQAGFKQALSSALGQKRREK